MDFIVFDSYPNIQLKIFNIMPGPFSVF